MKTLSLFDGMSCGQLAINQLGINNYEYFASEIDKYAIKVTQENFPKTFHIGDIKQISYGDLGFLGSESKTLSWFGGSIDREIDLLLGGSPCQGFSFAGKQLNFEDERSKLFFEYVRILKEVKPKYFLLENVRMKKEYQDVITEHLFGIEPTKINSSLVTAQNRQRLYWVGELQDDGSYKKLEIEQPKDRGILLKHILEENVDKKYNISEKQWEKLKNYESNSRLSPLDLKSYCLNTMQGGHRQPKIAYAPGSIEFKAQGWKENKSPTLCARDYKDPKVIMESNIRIDEFTKFNQDNVFCCKDDKVPTLTAGDGGLRPKTYSAPRIRKLTPLECERLQGVPDNYTNFVSNTQRYKMIGNGWTVPIITHILSHMNFN